MKEVVFSQYVEKDKLIEKLLKNGIVILDSNSLLNAYIYDNFDRKKYFEILEILKNRLMLTNLSAQEFYTNRLKLISNKARVKETLKSEVEFAIDKLIVSINTGDFNGRKQAINSFIKYEGRLQESIQEILNNTKLELEHIIDSHTIDIDDNYMEKDTVLDKMQKLFDDRVSEEFTKDYLAELFEEGQKRYETKMPPGYMDSARPEGERYRDLIIWNEIITIGQSTHMDVLFVSDDRNEDWCDTLNGMELGPRNELIKEFYDSTRHLYYSVSTENFIKHSARIFNIEDTESLQRQSRIIGKEMSSSK
ncbi:PIN-like domain-containing protein [Clostridium cellulovorans]|uniref:PIN like domain-containing protein n=1 Tax=Clostridium cellulovorans (strain ATCC 35296 / DSM 3052 / OCM 3 / 743B) TaxID=573061 RepID=D9SUF3_CLOC7|nr:PIN-like domain-containing protein [Clostridium cellulovorans]ADL52908.1 hypothetical protein Clocel_3222 [Clostridium cellulovorans 743B]